MSGSNPTVISSPVSNVTNLNAAIAIANGETAPGTYVIDLSGPITETAAVLSINLKSGVKLIIDGSGTPGGTGTLDGQNLRQGLSVLSGNVTVENLSIVNTVALGGDGAGGAGGGGGGGGAGLGGGLFVGDGTSGVGGVPSVTLINVGFSGDAAVGGAGGSTAEATVSNTAPTTQTFSGGLGGLLNGAPGNSGGAGYDPTLTGTPAAASFGGGAGGGGISVAPGSVVSDGRGGAASFGGGGGAGVNNPSIAAPGLGGGNSGGSNSYNDGSTLHIDGAPGGGGLGAGGDVFVADGATLTVVNSNLSQGSVIAGPGGYNTADGFHAVAGDAVGESLFIMPATTVSLAAEAGQTTLVADSIADETSLSVFNQGPGSLVIGQAGGEYTGTVELNGDNSYDGGTTIDSGTLKLDQPTSGGTGTITFASDADASLVLDFTVPVINNPIAGFASGDTIEIATPYSSSLTASLTGNQLVVGSVSQPNLETLTLNGTYNPNNFVLSRATDGNTDIQLLPTLTGLTDTLQPSVPAGSALSTGRVVTFTLTGSSPLTVDTTNGTPLLQFSDGATAGYVGTNSDGNLRFAYTVQQGQDTSDLIATGLALNGAAIADSNGNALPTSDVGVYSFAGTPPTTPAVTGTDTGLVVDTFPPVVQSVSAVPIVPSPLDAGRVVRFVLTLTEPVTATVPSGGKIQLNLSNGATAGYVSQGSASNTLVFAYTVQPGQSTPDLTVGSLSLSGGATITDDAGNALTRLSLGLNPGSNTGIVIDTTAPTVTTLTATPPGSTTVGNATVTTALNAGNTITFTLATSEPTIVRGTPTLQLNDGASAAYTGQDPAGDLVFTYTIAPGQNVSNLTATNLVSQTRAGAAITDAAGNQLAPISLSGFSAAATGIIVDTTQPTAPTGLAFAPGSDSGALGDGLTNVTTPTITGSAEPGSTVSLYDGTTLVGTGTAASATSATPGKFAITTSTLASVGHSLTAKAADAAGNVSLASSPFSFTINAVAPTITSVGFSSLSPTGTILTSGDVINFVLTPTEAVTVNTSAGTPQLTLSNGFTAGYTGQDTGGNLLFSYAVQANQTSSDVTVTGLVLGRATIKDAAGNTLSGAGIAALSGSNTNFAVDSTPPAVSVTSVVSDIAGVTLSGTTKPGATVTPSLDGTALAPVVSNSSTGAWSEAISPSAGLHQVSATATDLAGNASSAPATGEVIEAPAAVGGVAAVNVPASALGALGSNFSVQVSPDTEQVQVAGGAVSTGPDTEAAFITRLYDGILGRAPDATGLSQWNELITAGTTEQQVAQAFLTSPEYQAGHSGLGDAQFVTSLYQSFLGRAPATAEVQAWTGIISGGETRAQVVVGFADSTEAKQLLATNTAQLVTTQPDIDLVNEGYETAFGRAPDQAGLLGWTQALQAGLTPAAFAQDLVASPEFTAIHGTQSNADLVSSLYQGGLGRAPGQTELTTVTQALTSGTQTPAGLVLQIAQSTEAASHLFAVNHA